MPLPADLLRASQWVVEIIYFPLQTQLLKTARSIGCRTLDGGGMAIYQAVGAFRLFTGIAPDAAAHGRTLRFAGAASRGARHRGMRGMRHG